MLKYRCDLTGTQKVTVHNGKETQGANIHSKEVMTTVFSFSFVFVFFFVIVVVFQQYDNKRALQTGEQTCIVTDQQTLGRKNGDKEEDNTSLTRVNDDSAPMLKTKPKKAPDFRHPDEVIKQKKKRNAGKLLTDGHDWLLLCNVSSSRFKESSTKPPKEGKNIYRTLSLAQNFQINMNKFK